MKRVVMTFCVAFIACSLAAATPPPPIPKKPSDSGWAVTMSKVKDKSLLLRVRRGIPDGVQPEKYPRAIEMHWKYTPDSQGMPDAKVAAQIYKLEATIDPIQGDRLGYVMMIVTGSGERTWLWYVSDPKAFGAELNQLLPGHPFPITLNAGANEPDWKTYRAMREKVK